MLDNNKRMLIATVTIFTLAVLVMSFDIYLKYKITKTAMKNGYIQIQDDRSIINTLWAKGNQQKDLKCRSLN